MFTVSGRMQTQDIDPIRQLLDAEPQGQQLMLDLRNLTLISQDAVTFLAECEANGVGIENCPPYIRKWLDQKKCRKRGPRGSKQGGG